MLPSIMEVALQHELKSAELDDRSKRKKRSVKDVRFKCPFCKATDHPKFKDKYYLSLNTEDNVFQCWFCGESGGVLKFIALLENKSIEEVKQELFHKGNNRVQRKLHPAEKLTPSQLQSMGFLTKNWKKPSPRDLDWIWSEWLLCVEQEKRMGYMFFLEANTSEQILVVIHEYACKLSVNPEDLLIEFSQAKFANKKKPKWAELAEEWLEEVTL
ncbi:hypothetical protein [Desulfitobacterium chlororespirans]|uniref:CHC2 zinc finger n=1 Tax=Desulfitobacterium chlororespirans DSM 11544 TaxID=1121395 RepID=A0A1M7UTW2_9FIRM|nr:hypothetical protein [Desulfitobacterium chlororespirans]SHN86433.1 hypothetical protein SAMN02745215_04624 [Desulfitobacterium chlororespirans DSM 11544]